MQSMIKKLAVFFLFLFSSSIAYNQQILTNWKTAKQTDGIHIAYRFIQVGDSLKTRQMGIWFESEASPQQILAMFNNEDKLSQWTKGVKQCNIINQQADSWTTYKLYDIPWPFEQKDLVTHYQVDQDGDKLILRLRSTPDAMAYTQGVSRMQNYEAKWILKPLENGHTHVSFYSIAFSKPIMPRFIQDPVVQGVFIDSIQSLQALLANE